MAISRSWHFLVLVLSISSNAVNGIVLDLSSTDSIKSVASTIAYDMMSYYKGNLSGQIPGILPGPPPNPTITNEGYFWWEAGAMWGSLIDYWYYTGDTTYNPEVTQGMLFQVGADLNYNPANQSNGMGNDDEGFWGMSAMTAAELNYPNPPSTQPQWLALAQGVWNTLYSRMDNTTCGGGLHWQAFNYESGYNYKNSIANGCFFNIAARLAAYTGNMTYASQAESSWDWIVGVGLIDSDYNVYDGATTVSNCTAITKEQFSYNAAVYLLGAATMYNITGSDVWKARVNGLLDRTIVYFFPDGIAFEQACERKLSSCTIDMLSYKAYLTRWLAASTKVAPFTYDRVIAVLQTSATAAALQCCGSPADRPNGRMCGFSWIMNSTWDGTSGVGQQMAALEVITSNLILQSKAPVSNSTGGTSVGDPSAGTGPATSDPSVPAPATHAGRVGAGFLTTAVVIVVLSGLVWVSFPDGKVH